MKTTHYISAVITTALALTIAPAVQGAGEIFGDDFQSGHLADKWRANPDGTLGPEGKEWTVVSDPDVADGSAKVLCTPKMGTQIYLYHIEQQPLDKAGAGIALSFRFNADSANNEWNTTWTLFTAPILNGAYYVDGYSVRLWLAGDRNNLTPMAAICRVDPEGGRGNRTDIASNTLAKDAFHPGWNTVRFFWKADGTLTVSLNGKEVVSAKDTTHQLAFRTLGIVAWLSNNLPPPESLPDGRKLYFDDVKVESIDQ